MGGVLVHIKAFKPLPTPHRSDPFTKDVRPITLHSVTYTHKTTPGGVKSCYMYNTCLLPCISRPCIATCTSVVPNTQEDLTDYADLWFRDAKL